MFSFGFQQAYQRGFEQGDIIFFTTVCIFLLYNDAYLLISINNQCLETATAVVENMIDGLAPSGYMRYAPDGWSQFRPGLFHH